MYIFRTNFFYVGYSLYILSLLLPAYCNGYHQLNGFNSAYYAVYTFYSLIVEPKDLFFYKLYIGIMGLTNFIIILYPIASIFLKNIFWYSCLMIISTLWVIAYLLFENAYNTLTIGYYCWVLSYITLSVGSFVSLESLPKSNVFTIIISLVASFIAIYSFVTGNNSLKQIQTKVSTKNGIIYKDPVDKIWELELCMTEKKLMPIFNQKIAPPSSQRDIYISNLTFMNPVTSTSLSHTGIGKLINDAVIDGINLAQKSNNFIKHNVPGHTIKDTDGTSFELKSIIFDPILSRNEKIVITITELMKPANTDVILTGHYVEKEKTVDIRPFTIVKHEQKIVTKIATFYKEELLCEDPYSSLEKLCKKVHDQIAELVKELLLAL